MKNNLSIEKNLFFLLLGFFLLVGQGAVQSSDGMILLTVTKNIVENGTFAIIDEFEGFNLSFGVGNDGRKYSAYAPGTSVVMVPFYVLSKFIAWIFPFESATIIVFVASTFNSFISALIGVVLFRWCCKLDYSQKTSIGTVMVYSFLTMNLFHSKALTAHPLMSLFLLLSCYNIYFCFASSYSSYIISGFFLGMCFITRYEAVILVPFMILIIFIADSSILIDRLKKSFYFMTFIVFFISLLMTYNEFRYGEIMTSGGYAANEHISIGVILEGFSRLLFSPVIGIILFNPILLISLFYCFKLFRKNRKVMILFLLIIFPLLIFYSATENVSRSVFSWGPRHLLPILPFLIIPIGLLNLKKMNLLSKCFITLICALSLVIQLSSISVNPSRYFHEWNKKNTKSSSYPPAYKITESILMKQWIFIIDIYKNVKDPKFIERMKNSVKEEGSANRGMEYILKNNISLNMYNYWWLYMYFSGYSIYLICGAIVFLISIILFSIFNIYRSISIASKERLKKIIVINDKKICY